MRGVMERDDRGGVCCSLFACCCLPCSGLLCLGVIDSIDSALVRDAMRAVQSIVLRIRMEGAAPPHAPPGVLLRCNSISYPMDWCVFPSECKVILSFHCNT